MDSPASDDGFQTPRRFARQCQPGMIMSTPIESPFAVLGEYDEEEIRVLLGEEPPHYDSDSEEIEMVRAVTRSSTTEPATEPVIDLDAGDQGEADSEPDEDNDETPDGRPECSQKTVSVLETLGDVPQRDLHFPSGKISRKTRRGRNANRRSTRPPVEPSHEPLTKTKCAEVLATMDTLRPAPVQKTFACGTQALTNGHEGGPLTLLSPPIFNEELEPVFPDGWRETPADSKALMTFLESYILLVYVQIAVYYRTAQGKFTYTCVRTVLLALYGLYCSVGNLCHHSFQPIYQKVLEKAWIAMLNPDSSAQMMEYLMYCLVTLMGRTLDFLIQQALHPLDRSADICKSEAFIRPLAEILTTFLGKDARSDAARYLTGFASPTRPAAFGEYERQILLCSASLSTSLCERLTEEQTEPTKKTPLPKVFRYLAKLGSDTLARLKSLGLLKDRAISPSEISGDELPFYVSAVLKQDPKRTLGLLSITHDFTDNDDQRLFLPNELEMRNLLDAHLASLRAAPSSQTSSSSEDEQMESEPAPATASADTTAAPPVADRLTVRIIVEDPASGTAVSFLVPQEAVDYIASSSHSAQPTPMSEFPTGSRIRRRGLNGKRPGPDDGSEATPSKRPYIASQTSGNLFQVLTDQNDPLQHGRNLVTATYVFKFANHPEEGLEDFIATTSDPQGEKRVWDIVTENETTLRFYNSELYSDSQGLFIENRVEQSFFAKLVAALRRISDQHHGGGKTLAEKKALATAVIYQRKVPELYLHLAELVTGGIDQGDRTDLQSVGRFVNTELPKLLKMERINAQPILLLRELMPDQYCSHIETQDNLSGHQLGRLPLQFANLQEPSLAILPLLRKLAVTLYQTHPGLRLDVEAINALIMRSLPASYCTASVQSACPRANFQISTCASPPCLMSGGCLFRYSTVIQGLHRSQILPDLFAIAVRLDHLDKTAQLRQPTEVVTGHTLRRLNYMMNSFEKYVLVDNVLTAPIFPSLVHHGQTPGGVIAGTSPLGPTYGHHLRLKFLDPVKSSNGNPTLYLEYCIAVNQLIGILSDFGFTTVFSPVTGDVFLNLVDISSANVSRFCLFIKAVMTCDPYHSEIPAEDLASLFSSRKTKLSIPKRLIPEGGANTLNNLTEDQREGLYQAFQARLTILRETGPYLNDSSYMIKVQKVLDKYSEDDHPFQETMDRSQRIQSMKRFLGDLHQAKPHFREFCEVMLAPHLYPPRTGRSCPVPFCNLTNCKHNREALTKLLQDLEAYREIEQSPVGIENKAVWKALCQEIRTSEPADYKGEIKNQFLTGLDTVELGPAMSQDGKYTASVSSSRLCEYLEGKGWTVAELERLLPIFFLSCGGVYRKAGDVNKRRPKTPFHKFHRTYYYTSRGTSYLVSLTHDVPTVLADRYLMLERTLSQITHAPKIDE